MPRKSISYDILIASPSDTAAEREIVAECIREWNSAHSSHSGIACHDLRWEIDSTPSFGERGQQIINDQLVDRADILIGIFKSRLGKPTGAAQSGTVEEIERFVSANKPVMLYFSTGSVPRDHDPEQLALVKSYEQSISGKAIYKPFSDEHDLRRKVSRDLSATMAKITNAEPRPPQQNSLAKVYIRTRRGERSGDVETVRVSAVIENISQNRKIKDFVVTLSVPRACLTHSSGLIDGELPQDLSSKYRSFRRSNETPGIPSIIFQGDKVPIFALDIGVGQLLMKGTYLAGDYEGTLADKVTVKAVVEGEVIEAERMVADIFANPQQG